MKKKLLFFRAVDYVAANKLPFLLQIYWFIYLPAFVYIERKPVSKFHEVYCFLDDLVPFVPQFVLGYYAWFLIFLLSFVYTFSNDLSEYKKQCLTVFGGFTFFIILSLAYPNIQLLRPTEDMLNGTDIFTRMCVRIYRHDTPTNVMPSMHVYQAIACTIATVRTAHIKKSPLAKTLLWIACILISLSTVFIKQHSVMDIFGAVMLAIAFYIFTYIIIPVFKTRKVTKKSGFNSLN